MPDVEVGDYTIVHVGFALTKLDEESALETLELFRARSARRARRAEPVGGACRSAARWPVKYLDEFGTRMLARALLDEIHATVTRPWAIMEVCGGQTHTIIRNGIDQLLPEQVS